LLKARGCKGQLIDSDNEEGVIRSTIFSSFFLGKEKAGEIWV